MFKVTSQQNINFCKITTFWKFTLEMVQSPYHQEFLQILLVQLYLGLLLALYLQQKRFDQLILHELRPDWKAFFGFKWRNQVIINI